MYALAASAAGVGILAGALPVEAKIIYTSADIHIHALGGTVKLDLNHDGITDVSFQATYHHNSRTFGGQLTMYDPFTNALFGFVAVASHHLVMAAALPKGRKIGPGAAFQGNADGPMALGGYATFGGTISYGPWNSPTKRGYLGLRFAIKGKAHYAWVRVERVASKRFHYPAVITGFAYENIPGKAIIAGATKGPDDEPTASRKTYTPGPATLGALALGAPGLSIWRREESACAAPEGI
jgi:hypothetical protein